MNILIREPTIDDAAELIRFVKRAGNEPSISIGFHPGEFQMTIEEEVAFIQRHLGSDNTLMLVAESEGHIIGDLTLEGGRALCSRHKAILGIMVDQDWRGRGVGSLLLQRAIDWARQSSVLKRLELEVYVRNVRAMALYHRFGFVIEGRRQKSLFREGEYHDDYIMGLIL